jgi:hypothetical protein
MPERGDEDLVPVRRQLGRQDRAEAEVPDAAEGAVELLEGGVSR